MAKLKLLYVAFFTEKPTRPEEYLHSKIIDPLKQRGMFKEDSEILEVHRTPFANCIQIDASISPAYDTRGSPVSVYSRYCRPENFHRRNMQQYIDFLASGGDILPIYIEDEMERRRAGNFVRWKFEPPKEPLSPEHEYTDGRDWDNAVENLIRMYIRANPNPNIRIAIVHGAMQHVGYTLDAFLRQARKVATPVKVKVRQ